ncbi:MAG TPA: DUF3108 domain-containing protein [Alphaproteobacteria bacterium]|nr:DUF3108 domain-containing protein [Alphaproteobacteria bacterium]
MHRNGVASVALAGALALIAACGASRPAAAAAAAPADQPRALSLRYDIYVGGFYVFAFDATVGLESGAYQVALQGGTAGFVGRMFPWRAWMDSKGSVASVDPAPTGLTAARFDNVAEWHRKAKRTSVTFENGGRYAIEHDPPESPPDPRDDPLPSSLPSGTLDPVAAAIAALAGSARDGGCERRVPVFDGKRRYDLIVHNGDGLTTLKPNHLSAYRGLALSCRIAIDAISGFSKKRRYVQWGDAGSNTDQPTVWAAWFAPDMPLVPVRFLASVSIGGNESTIMVHLVHAEVRDGHGTRVLANLSR